MIGNIQFQPTVCGCSCHSGFTGTIGAAHPGMPCWCYQSQGPIVAEAPKFCPHCGKKL